MSAAAESLGEGGDRMEEPGNHSTIELFPGDPPPAAGPTMPTPTKETPRRQGHQGERTTDSRKHTEFPKDARGLPIFDHAGLEVLKAWRYFSTVPGDAPAIVAALLVIAWAIKGRLS
ncbi:MAG: hypothetical protein CO126_11585 [Hydrogenophilales bacterium CG_4_9_14_3_um_filter_63_34]|nr:MAG: hypothetical protein COZ24_04740 [Hydrogenophilales bacterium CG_4_10_14_3_um_filter_63_21]PJB02525.1 MAG: hypothetical protein CO126_11585 [Hydrogenophilales bacterium CG_4_9_14_3_um_filter_63_34]